MWIAQGQCHFSLLHIWIMAFLCQFCFPGFSGCLCFSLDLLKLYQYSSEGGSFPQIHRISMVHSYLLLYKVIWNNPQLYFKEKKTWDKKSWTETLLTYAYQQDVACPTFKNKLRDLRTHLLSWMSLTGTTHFPVRSPPSYHGEVHSMVHQRPFLVSFLTPPRPLRFQIPWEEHCMVTAFR